MNIREASEQDQSGIRDVYSSAFPPGEGEIVGALALDLVSEKTTPKIWSFVAERDGRIIAHVAFSPVSIADHTECLAYILAPLAVQREGQQQGHGSALVASGMQQLSEQGVHIVFVYGDPGYYERFGFTPESAQSYTTPYELQYPFGWQACVLSPCPVLELPASITCVAPLNDPELW